MSKENVKNFYEMLKVDANLAQELMKLKEELEKGDKKFLNDEYVINEKIIPLAKKHGLSFTADEFTSVSTKLLNKLDEEDLLKVSGGGPFGNIVATLMSFLQSFVSMPFGYNETNVANTAQVIQAEGQQHQNIPEPDMQENEPMQHIEILLPDNQENDPQPLADTLLELAKLATSYLNNDENLNRVLFLGKDIGESFRKFETMSRRAFSSMARFPLGRDFVLSKGTNNNDLKDFFLDFAKFNTDNETIKNLDKDHATDVFVALVYHLIAYRVGGVRNVDNFNYDEALNACPKLKRIFDSANVEELRAILTLKQ